MKEQYYDIIKFSSLAVITVCLIINIISYVNLFSLRQTNKNLQNQLSNISSIYNEKQDYYDYLVDNKDELNDVFLREENDLLKKGETLINF